MNENAMAVAPRPTVADSMGKTWEVLTDTKRMLNQMSEALGIHMPDRGNSVNACGAENMRGHAEMIMTLAAENADLARMILRTVDG